MFSNFLRSLLRSENTPASPSLGVFLAFFVLTRSSLFSPLQLCVQFQLQHQSAAQRRPRPHPAIPALRHLPLAPLVSAAPHPRQTLKVMGEPPECLLLDAAHTLLGPRCRQELRDPPESATSQHPPQLGGLRSCCNSRIHLLTEASCGEAPLLLQIPTADKRREPEHIEGRSTLKGTPLSNQHSLSCRSGGLLEEGRPQELARLLQDTGSATGRQADGRACPAPAEFVCGACSTAPSRAARPEEPWNRARRRPPHQ